MKALHQGRLIGAAGTWLSVLIGISTASLILIGAVLYGGMYRRRRSMGRREFLW
ncbi:hypothetical protein [Sphingomonas sp.]|uniref:hypothetical protein n=1 Tax=Sphingomonas sp. TaxID=28214 RepID=UPI0025E2EF68|nr:hypothetical protein [Sphingomonas sp.]